MPLVFLPERSEFFWWGDECVPTEIREVAKRGHSTEIELLTPARRAWIGGTSLPLLDTVAGLSLISTTELAQISGSLATWSLASKFVLDLVSRERVVPIIGRQEGQVAARWGAALSHPNDTDQLKALARAMPPAAHAVPATSNRGRDIWAAEALLRAFINATVDALVRTSTRQTTCKSTSRSPKASCKRVVKRSPLQEVRSHPYPDDGDEFVPWEQRWATALTTDDATFVTNGFGERHLIDDLQLWSAPALGTVDRLRACFRLELPRTDKSPFVLRFLLQSLEDPSLLVTAKEVWNVSGRSLIKLGPAFSDPQESLLKALGRASKVYPALVSSLGEARPEGIKLDPSEAWQFLNHGALELAEAGFGVMMPAELSATGQRKIRLRMRIRGGTPVAGTISGAAGLKLEELLAFQWEAALGDETLSAQELKALAKHKAPLVRYRGQWIIVDPRELPEITRKISKKSEAITIREALVAALSGEMKREHTMVTVTTDDAFAKLLRRLREPLDRAVDRSPPNFMGTLRPYQGRGLAWLHTMGALGLGACLADDMGLGKTIQILALLLHDLANDGPASTGPVLLVAPTSVVGNWEREAQRFAPSLQLLRHYGPLRAKKSKAIPRKAGMVVITSYGLLRRDVKLLSSISWSTVILDEAQNIKNAASSTAKAARVLSAKQRFALTGTPVENRLAELWSIFEFINPGLLGPLKSFRHSFAIPIERYGNNDSATRLRQITSPFLLRRLKSDPSILQDLPPKNEMKVVCTLTREQTTLYQAVVDEEMHRIESSSGIERKGRVLALLMFLKQICNHPAQYLGEAGPLSRRSGKLERCIEMLEEAVAVGDKTLVFTQYREMGKHLFTNFQDRLGVEVLFLHGGTPRRSRDAMVRRFQEDACGPPIFVLSVKAGGTGLNLTAANHVFHFDRWWNPAVEDQATDRAYRIGQKRSVQVHKMVCAGTVEEKINRMLEEKRQLASKVVGTGEKWITELDNQDLHDLFALSTQMMADQNDNQGASIQRSHHPRRPNSDPKPRMLSR